ncbi:phosphate ABC transporter substrate-binding protein PstS [Taylorella equigenitalis]|uniref:Phosphate-binding protein PstS n=1 Tax=Taylorella equigenitalis (strain MCE9) TaxID=937774 RepID=A0A654KFK1_TAYEM|nr:phosphate ABC transporter substrate-binding protein PstS [Taylorella equigenitalis]ADU91180.1 Phosphate ABC transporter, periplasmic phosphate-binding protein PstS [Taylorella equigenitalis MCE9]WDU56010.1 phosphate ABC transporter substrate-binding protein PstS [Taylorella equigenitalis]
MLKHALKGITVAVALSTASFAVQAVEVTGAGASFPYPVYSKWATDFEKETGNKINYQSIGSGGGQKAIIDKTVDFAGSDDPMSADKLEENGLFQFPSVVGGTVAVVNITGVKPGQLILNGEVLADIFLGKIKKWNDAKIAALNSNVSLPDADIIVVHRSDSSGTSFGFTNYLSKVSADWKNSVGEGKSVKWPVGQGGKGNGGVAGLVSKIPFSIGYVEYAYAKQNGLAWTGMQNAEGKVVQPEQSTFAAAASSADWKGTPGMGVVLTNEPGADSWPMTSATFILVHKQVEKPEQVKTALQFFDYAWSKGAKTASDLDYVPLPDAVTNAIREEWKAQLKTADGQSIW